MIKAGIIGATGYAGAEIAKILYSHPEVAIVSYGSKSYEGEDFSEIYGQFRNLINENCSPDDLDALVNKADVIFTATPQGYLAGKLTKELLSKCKFIDLSADYRLTDVDIYEKWYKIKHQSPDLIKEAVYGLCEINREQIKHTRLLANPGCFTTCSILTAYPLVKEGLIDPSTLIIDALSGVTGAGRGAKTANLYCEVNESAKPYGVAVHRHTPEIEEQLSKACGKNFNLNFTPHLVPMNRGILATEYASLVNVNGRLPSEKTIRAAYEKYYKDEYFIRLLPDGKYPETKFVEHTNFVDIGFKVDPRTNRIIMMGAIDNLVKGAAGQAVQNMNIMFGLPENTGLKFSV